jgi:maltooligosyltrehalose trehalohydrolase
MFKIWAPEAENVTLCLKNKEHEMSRAEGGYWVFDLEDKPENLLYSFKIDQKGPFPDPRSSFQPGGIHGPSQLWNKPYKWKDKSWTAPELKDAVIYELHVGTFSEKGTFAGVQDKLDYLKSLGITHIELLPIADFPGQRGWGYDGVDLFAPHQGYGTPDDLKKLVDACHQKGLGIVLDVVYNHLGPDGNYLGVYGKYFSDRYSTPWGEAVNFDCSYSDAVRKFVIDNALMWLNDFHFDGLRIDAVHQIYDFSAIHILEEMQQNVARLEQQTKRKYFLIAESDLNDPRLIKSPARGGYGLAAHWLDDFHHALHVLLTDEQHGYYQDFNGAEDLHKSLTQNYIYDGIYSKSRKCRHGRDASDLSPEKFVVFSQNHDQVGNRGFGERLSKLIDFASCQFAAAVTLLSPFVPMLFQGEEWAAQTPFLYFTDHGDEKLARAVRKGRQRDYSFLHKKVPDPQDEKTFLASCLNWKEPDSKDGATMLDWYKKLIAIRQKYLKQIRAGERAFEAVNLQQKLFLYRAGKLKLVFNGGRKVCHIKNEIKISDKLLLQNKSVEKTEKGLQLPAGAVVVFWQK